MIFRFSLSDSMASRSPFSAKSPSAGSPTAHGAAARSAPPTTLLAALLLAAALLPAAAPRTAHAVTPAELNSKIEALSDRIHTLQGKIGKLQNQENAAQADLNRRIARQRRVAAQLGASRRRAARLKAELAHAKRVLSARVVAVYKSGEPNILTVALQADGFAQMVERATYLKRVADNDRHTINTVADLKSATNRESARLAQLEQRQGVLVAEVRDRRDAIAGAKNNLTADQGKLSAQIRRDRRALAAATVAVTAQPEPPSPRQFSDGGGDGDKQVSPLFTGRVTLGSDGNAHAPGSAPAAIKSAVAAGNQIARTPYIWGGGHGSFSAKGYDCSGSVSYVLHGAGILSSPLASGGLASWGKPGPGRWITVYAHGGHTFMTVGGLRFDTSGRSGTGSRWQSAPRSGGGYAIRHWPGL